MSWCAHTCVGCIVCRLCTLSVSETCLYEGYSFVNRSRSSNAWCLPMFFKLSGSLWCVFDLLAPFARLCRELSSFVILCLPNRDAYQIRTRTRVLDLFLGVYLISVTSILRKQMAGTLRSNQQFCNNYTSCTSVLSNCFRFLLIAVALSPHSIASR